MAKFHTLPWKLEPYFADTKHLTCEQHGAYLQLLALTWRTNGAAIDLSDDLKIARIISTSPKRWRAMKPIVLRFFDQGQDGLYRQKRLTAIYAKVDELVEKRAAAGRKGGRPKRTPNGADQLELTDLQASQSDKAKSLENNEEDKAEAFFEKSTQSQSQSQRVSNETPSPLTPQGELSTRLANRAPQWPEDACEQLIALWPHKVGLAGPRGLRASWQQIEMKHTGTVPWQDVIEGAKRHIAAHRPSDTWLKPLTFMLDERWTDQPANTTTTGKTVAITPSRTFHGFSSVVAKPKGLDHDRQQSPGRVQGQQDILPPLPAGSEAGDAAGDPRQPRRQDGEPLDVQHPRRAHTRRP